MLIASKRATARSADLTEVDDMFLSCKPSLAYLKAPVFRRGIIDSLLKDYSDSESSSRIRLILCSRLILA
jgi:hypothetical protein